MLNKTGSGLLTLVLTLLLVLTGCQYTGFNDAGGLGGTAASSGLYREGLPGTANWAVLPFVNYSEATSVTTQVERILMVQLPSRGIENVRLYPESEVTTASKSLEGAHRYKNGKQWAMQNDISFAVAGEIFEWYYDDSGRPQVSMGMAVIDIRNGEVIWSVNGSSEGLQGDDLFDISRGLMSDLLQSLPINRRI
ncbi:hypothetical protein [Endozoicomonas numazuensis]|uniref:Lipoprotein n=1 Tax=Endozoicomonas numazuensis TaxID=1137799 RepID=A0A081NDX3_9GAMM|nr:hypothetical protein [Endozoicomonas numazuensis]KEQ16646.1 hypothetical protein GZ78_22770 [Endozoicomonas numazuensis]